MEARKQYTKEFREATMRSVAEQCRTIGSIPQSLCNLSTDLLPVRSAVMGRPDNEAARRCDPRRLVRERFFAFYSTEFFTSSLLNVA